MRKFIVTLSITAFAVVIASQVQAAPKGNHPSSKSTAHSNNSSNKQSSFKSTSNSIHASNYHLQHGTKFSNGFKYVGKNHSHWTQTRFDTRYGCTCYFDSGLSRWYYWCARDVCYYPVSYCPYQCYSCTEVVTARPVCTEVVTVRPVCTPVCVQPICVPTCNCYSSFAAGIAFRTGWNLHHGYHTSVHGHVRHR